MRIRLLSMASLSLPIALSCAAGNSEQPRPVLEQSVGTKAEYRAMTTDTLPTTQIAELIRTSPVLEPSRSLEREALFVRDVNNLLRQLNEGEAVDRVTSVDEAMVVLEALMEERMATIRVTSPRPGFRVDIRRWRYRDSKVVPWSPLIADTTLRRSAVMYQFRYRPPSATRDTVVDVPCADGCDLRLPL